MCAKWRNGYDPHFLIESIEPFVDLSKQGNLVSSGPNYMFRLKHVLESAIDFDPEIPSCELDRIVSRAVKVALRGNSFTANSLKVALTREEAKFKKKETVPYVLATSISFREKLPFRKLSIDGHDILFTQSLPKSFDRHDAEKRLNRILSVPLPRDYTAVRVTSDGRTPAEAADKARDALGFLMGIWNLILTKGSTTISLTGTSNGPIASLRLGPLRTLHNLDGSMATPTIWFAPTYTKPAPVKDYSKNFDNLRKTWRWIYRQVNKSPDSEILRKAFIRYGAAVTESGLHSAYLELWGLLEQLTDTGLDSYARTIKRAAFIYEDPRLPHEELQHLRDLRNNMVHLGQSSDAPQEHVYQLKRYVDDLFVYLLQKSVNKLTRTQINEILDLPTDLKELKTKLEESQRKSEVYSRVLRLRTR